MKITIRFDDGDIKDGLDYRVGSGIKDFIHWLGLTDAYRKIWAKNDIEMNWADDKTIVVIGDQKYEQTILGIIENAKNGAYEMM